MPEADESKQPARLTRDELYRLVWKTPLSRLSERYGITGNGLAKICDRLNVPYPPRGHWTKVALGKKVIKTRLPKVDEATPQDVVIRPTSRSRITPAIPPKLQAELDRLRADTNRAKVPSRLVKPHPIIANWLAERDRKLEEARLERDPWRTKMFAPKPFTPLEHRRHRILDALFKELQRHGAEISEDGDRSLHVALLMEKIELQLREKQKQVRRPPTEEENRWEWNRKRGYVQELQPTGRLIFAIKTYLGNGLRSEWLETDAAPMEGLLPDVVAGILTAAPFLAERTRKRDEERRLYEAAEHRRHEREQRQKLVRNRLRKFVKFAKQWRDIKLAQEFLATLRVAQLDPGRKVGDKTLLQWVDWTEANLREVDPLQQGAVSIFSDIAEVTAWTYND